MKCKPCNLIIVILFLLFSLAFTYGAMASELYYQKAWCPNPPGTTLRDILTNEVVGYADCLTDTHAYEFDFAKGLKVYEAIGQSLYYAMLTGRKPGIVLIAGPDDNRFVRRCRAIIDHYNLGIDLEVIPK